MNQCIRLALSMDTFAEKSSYEELKQAAIGITSTIGNLRSGMSNYLNMREPNLNKDYIDDYPDINDVNIKIKTSKSNNYKPCFLNAETFKFLCVLIVTDRAKFIKDCYTDSSK